MSRVAVIILNYNRSDLTANCIACFKRLSLDYSIFLIDNASTGDDVSILKSKFPDIHLIQSEVNLGFAGGNNLGIDCALKSGFEYILLLNNDTIFEQDFIFPLVNELEDDRSLAAIQPKIMYEHDRNLVWNAGGLFRNWIGASLTIGEAAPDNGQFQKGRFIDWITGCCILVRSDVIEEIGLLDHRFFMYQEDVDWSLRMKNANYSLKYTPNSIIFHIAGGSSKSQTKGREGFQSPFVHFVNQRNRYWVLRKNLSWFYLPTATCYHLMRALIFLTYFLIRWRPTKFKATLLGLLAGFSPSFKEEIPEFKN